MPSIRYWLKHNHPKYRERLEITTVNQPQEALNAEQEAYVRDALRLSTPQDLEIKTDDDIGKQDKDIETDEQDEPPSQAPPEDPKPEEPQGPIEMTPQELAKIRTEITRPIIVKTPGQETTYYPHGEKTIEFDSGAKTYCPPNPGVSPTSTTTI